ncbi:MAG: hypothetical protein AAGH72_00095 [Verrucomicrobiota bacterium]
MITVATLGDIHQAQLLRSYLQSEGIEADLPDEMTILNTWHLAHAIGGVRVQVVPQDLESAQHRTAEFLKNLDQPVVHRCPECDSTHTSDDNPARNWTLFGFVVVILIAVGIFAPVRPKYRCRDCQHSFYV